ncbi:MAG: hypothetical protein HPY53_02630 [Brevinematales bacterium]|nr:hypothetical protein [Brevinematales bacterium]
MKSILIRAAALGLFLFSGNVLFATPVKISPESQKQLKKLEAKYPTIYAQVNTGAENDLLGIDYDNALYNLSGYLADTGADIRQGMDMILQASFYQSKTSPPADQVTIDGDASEWAGAGWDKLDEKGDNPGKNPALDIVRASAVIHDGILYGVIETAKKPTFPNRFVVYLDTTADGYYDYQFIAGWEKDGTKVSWMNDFVKKVSGFPFEADVFCGNVFEYAIPLDQISTKLKDMPEMINIGVQTADKDFKYTEGLDLIPVCRVMENLPLTMLLYLMDKGVAPEGDSIPEALSLANGFLYSVSDKTVRGMIAKDLVKQYELYKKICEWQEGWGCPYPLEKLPVIPKIFWADRSRYSDSAIYDAMRIFKVKSVTKEIYNEFVDKIGILEAIHGLVVKNNLAKKDISITAGVLDEWVHRYRLYLSSMENLEMFNKWGWYTDEMLAKAKKMKNEGKYFQNYFGREHRWDDFAWLNYQYGHFIKDGCFIGDCGSTTVVQMGVYRMAGIAPVSFQMIDLSDYAVYTHNFPGYFDPALNRWCFYQVPNPIGPGGKYMGDNAIVLHFNKPFPHPWLYYGNYQNIKVGKKEVCAYLYYPGEMTVVQKMINFLKTGLPAKKMDTIFMTNITLVKGLLFDKTSAPDKLTDSDNDGLYDIVENDIGLNAAGWDSDGDGYSDLWELHNGQNPLKTDAWGTVAVDGFIGEWKGSDGVTVVKDPQGDSTVKVNVFDIAAFYVLPKDEKIYLGCEFFGEPAKSSLKVFGFWIDAPGRFPVSYWFGVYDKEWGSYTAMAGNMEVNYQPEKWSNLNSVLDEHYVIGKDIEAALPMAYIYYPVWLSVKVILTSGPKGNEVRGSDEADRVYIKIAEDGDNDSLSDEFEIKIGADPAKWDTDGDLISDNWEYWHGYDPLSAKSPALKNQAALDGFADDIEKLPGAAIGNDPKGDTLLQDNGYDIASIAAAKAGGNLYIGVKFHGDNTYKSCVHYALEITADGSRQYWVGSGWDTMAGPDIYQSLWITKKSGKSGDWPAIPKMDGAWLYAKRDAEFVIPLAYLGNPKTITVKAAVTIKTKENDNQWNDDSGELKL